VRLLPTVRLSLENDERTSPDRQMARMQAHAQFNNHTLIPIGPGDYDLGVSGSVPPWDRPGLGKWLKDDRLGEWDGLIAAKLDRLTRSLLDFERLVKWLEERGKILVCLDPAIDLTTPAGKAFAQVIVVFAEFERETIRARVRDAYDKLRKDGKYPGGQIGFGYMAVKLDRNWGIVPDPEYAPVVRAMADRYVRFESFGSISKWLNENGVPSPRDAIRKRQGKPLKGTPWTAVTVKIVLRGPGILGAATSARGEAVRDDDGEVIYRAAPLIDRETWEKVQARIGENRTGAKVNTTALLRVAFCTCGQPLYAATTRRKSKYTEGGIYVHRYYHCFHARTFDQAGGPKCSAKRIYAEKLEEKVFGALLDLVGRYELTEKRMTPGRDFAEDIARVKDTLSHLAGDIEMGEALGDDVAELVAKRDRARAELRRLVAMEPVAAGVETVKTGKTFRQHWESLGTVQRNEFLRSAGVRVEAHRDKLPPLKMRPGPLTATGLDVLRTAIIDDDDLKAVVHLGGLADLLDLASAA
jgi:DNA invertase Pin-like site-specific DNA recombinase